MKSRVLCSLCLILHMFYLRAGNIPPINCNSKEFSLSTANYSSRDTTYNDTISDFSNFDNSDSFSVFSFSSNSCEMSEDIFVLKSPEYKDNVEINTLNSQDLKDLEEGNVFPKLERLEIISKHLSLFENLEPLLGVKFFKIIDHIKNKKLFREALSKVPNLEELIIVDSELKTENIRRVVDTLRDSNLLKKITIKGDDSPETLNLLLELPQLKKIVINQQSYDRNEIEELRKNRNIQAISASIKNEIINNVKMGFIDKVKKSEHLIDVLRIRKNLLNIALYNEDIKMLDLLITKESDANIRYTKGNTLLINASRNNNKDIAQLLINKGADINAKNEIGETAFFIALVYNNIDLVQLLIKKGIDVNEIDKYGYTPLMRVAKYGNSNITKALLKKTTSKDIVNLLLIRKNKIPLTNKEITDLRNSIMIDINATNKYGNTALMTALDKRNIKVAKLLIQKGANINIKNAQGYAAIDFAAHKRFLPDMLQLLIDKGADVNKKCNDGQSLLSKSFMKRNKKIIQILLENGAKVDTNSNELADMMLWTTKTNGDRETQLSIVNHLLKYKNAINIKDNNGNTPLDYAIKNTDFDIANAFVKKGASLNELNGKYTYNYIYQTLLITYKGLTNL